MPACPGIGRLSVNEERVAPITFATAMPEDGASIAVMVGELLGEIMTATGVRHFNFNLGETGERARDLLMSGRYVVFLARDSLWGKEAGFLALYESCALYAEGCFGVISELFVRPEYRGRGVGGRLLQSARELGMARGWRRLEVTTPPLPEYAGTLKFYERQGYAVTGGRKLKLAL